MNAGWALALCIPARRLAEPPRLRSPTRAHPARSFPSALRSTAGPRRSERRNRPRLDGRRPLTPPRFAVSELGVGWTTKVGVRPPPVVLSAGLGRIPSEVDGSPFLDPFGARGQGCRSDDVCQLVPQGALENPAPPQDGRREQVDSIPGGGCRRPPWLACLPVIALPSSDERSGGRARARARRSARPASRASAVLRASFRSSAPCWS